MLEIICWLGSSGHNLWGSVENENSGTACSKIIKNFKWAPMTHTYNPISSGGRDQEDRGLSPAQANSL
jgi:hypothetical protein